MRAKRKTTSRRRAVASPKMSTRMKKAGTTGLVVLGGTGLALLSAAFLRGSKLFNKAEQKVSQLPSKIGA